MENYLQYRYKLETHLKTVCDLNKDYANLYDTWELNKKTFASVLKNVVCNYPSYSLHDNSHSESIITNIEMLLGEDRIKRLSPTETWMILHCAYIHDFGMVLPYKLVEEAMESEEFKEYLEEKKSSFNRDIIKAIEYIENLKKNISNKDFDMTWPLKVRKYVTEIISDYFRGKHSSLSNQYLNMLEEWNIDIAHNNLIQDRLVKMIGKISSLHTEDFDKILELDFETNGHKSDYMHPRFVAAMIRMGDLLDLDNGRFCNYTEKVNGEMPSMSEVHKKKHESTRHVLIKPEVIEVSADCPDEIVYRETRNWFIWLGEEIKNLTMSWTDIVPTNLTGYAPKLKKKQILLKGEEDLNKVIDLRFQISQEKAFDILEGSNLYEDKLIFIREFIQNAMDASKIQLWRDLKNERYLEWAKSEKYNSLDELQPFYIKKEIFENYKIEVIINDKDEKNVEVIVKDRGIGISLDTVRRMCNVAESYSVDENLKREIQEMPNWLRPTGGFGIGLQSAFLVTDEFYAYSKTEENTPIRITFQSRKADGYISVKNCRENIKRGCEFHIDIPKNSQDKLMPLTQGNNFDFIMLYDSFSQKSLIKDKIIRLIYENLSVGLFPIVIDNHISQLSDIINFDLDKIEHEEEYDYQITDNFEEIQIWDKKYGIYIVLSMFMKDIFYTKGRNSTLITNNIALFKDIKIRLECDPICEYINIYGFDSKKYLNLNRTELKEEGIEIINGRIKKYKELYIEKFFDSDITKDYNHLLVGNFFISAYNLNRNFNALKYDSLVDKCDDIYVRVLKKEKNKFNIEDMSFKEILKDYPNLTYISTRRYVSYDIFNKENNIKDILNESGYNSEEEYIILTENLIFELTNFKVGKIKALELEDNVLEIYSVKDDNKQMYIQVDDFSKKKMIDNLGEYGYTMSNQYYEYEESYNDFRDYKRNCMPAIEGYEKLAVDVKNIWGVDYYPYNVNQVVSPITVGDGKKIKSFSDKKTLITKESFIESIIKRDDYSNLVDYTLEYNLSKESVTREIIDSKYKELIGEYYDIMKEKETDIQKDNID